MRDKAPEKMGTVVPLFEAVPFEKSMARLAQATAGMEAAVMEQKEIVAAFRSTMDELRDKTEQLDQSCQLLHRTFERINVKPLRAKSLRLARIVDSLIANAI